MHQKVCKPSYRPTLVGQLLAERLSSIAWSHVQRSRFSMIQQQKEIKEIEGRTEFRPSYIKLWSLSAGFFDAFVRVPESMAAAACQKLPNRFHWVSNFGIAKRFCLGPHASCGKCSSYNIIYCFCARSMSPFETSTLKSGNLKQIN